MLEKSGFYTPLLKENFSLHYMRRKLRFYRGLWSKILPFFCCRKKALQYTLAKTAFGNPLLQKYFENFCIHYMRKNGVLISHFRENCRPKNNPLLYAAKNGF